MDNHWQACSWSPASVMHFSEVQSPLKTSSSSITEFRKLQNLTPGPGLLVLHTRICTWPIPVPSPLVLVWEEAVSLLFLNDIYFWISDSSLLLLCPSSYFWKQRHRFPVRVTQEGPVSPAFWDRLCTAVLGLLQPHSRKVSNIQGNPLLTLLLLSQKKVVMMCLLRHGPGQRVFFILSKGRKWVIDFLFKLGLRTGWLSEL